MKRIESDETGDAFVRELALLNASIGPKYLEPYRAYRPLTLAVLCSDARVPSSRLLPGHGYFAVKTAGNVFDPDANALPDSLQYAVVIAHESGDRMGCGACDGARDYLSDPESSSEALAETPELRALLQSLRPDVWDNAREVTISVQRAGIVDSSRVYAMVYSHVEGRAYVPDGMPGGRTTEEISRHAAASCAGFGPLDPRQGDVLDIRRGQQPRAVVINTLAGIRGRSFGHFFPTLSLRYLQPNAVFEAKSPVIGGISSRLVASAQYALMNALGGDSSFSSTGHCFVLAESLDQLQLVWGRLSGEASLRGFVARGGSVWGLIPDADFRISFYDLE